MSLAWEVKQRLAANRDPELESAALDWIEQLIGEKIDRSKPFEDVLKDGIYLCKAINAIKPGSVGRINQSNLAFKQMENLAAFQEALKAYGVPVTDVFQTGDLYEKKNLVTVAQCIVALGRTCQNHPEYKGPVFGPKMAESDSK